MKILFVFICEDVANQLQQSKGCCGVNYILPRIHAEEEVFYKIMSNWRLEQKFNCRLVFWDRSNSGKILYTCNHLFLINGFLGVITWNSLGGIFFFFFFFFARGFPHLSTNKCVYFIFAALSLFGDLLVPPRFACNLT